MLLASSPPPPPLMLAGPSEEAIEMSPPMLDESVEVSSSWSKLLSGSVVVDCSLVPPVLVRVDPSPPAVVVVPVPVVGIVIIPVVTARGILNGC